MKIVHLANLRDEVEKELQTPKNKIQRAKIEVPHPSNREIIEDLKIRIIAKNKNKIGKDPLTRKKSTL